jgi:hypothetical protein
MQLYRFGPTNLATEIEASGGSQKNIAGLFLFVSD